MKHMMNIEYDFFREFRQIFMNSACVVSVTVCLLAHPSIHMSILQDNALSNVVVLRRNNLIKICIISK
jgi:hypothetical protein